MNGPELIPVREGGAFTRPAVGLVLVLLLLLVVVVEVLVLVLVLFGCF